MMLFLPKVDELVTGSFVGDVSGGRVLLDYLVEKNVYQHVTYVDQQVITIISNICPILRRS